MRDETHTPGPWASFCTAKRGTAKVAQFDGPVIATLSGTVHNGQTWANARLIVAAPDLLAALELVAFASEEPYRHAVNNQGPTYQSMLQALAAIAQEARAAIKAAKGA